MKRIRTQPKRAIIFIAIVLSACSSREMDAIVATQFPVEEALATAEPMVDEPLETAPAENLLPAGLLTSSDEEGSVSFYNLQGELSGFALAPGLVSADPDSIHIAGRADDEKQIPELIYRSWTPDQALIFLEEGQPEKIRETGSFLALAGARGEPFFAFSEIYLEKETPKSYLFAGGHDSIQTAAPILELSDDKTAMALKPVGTAVSVGDLGSVWYTKTAWGIGGIDLIFPIQRGLYLYDIQSGESQTILPDSRNFQGISPDLSLSASTNFGIDESGPLLVSYLDEERTVEFPLHPDSNRGAGFAVFSPDNHYAAWMEGQGSMASYEKNFSARVRIGELITGTILQELDNDEAADFLGWAEVRQLKPSAWLDNETLIIEARGADWSGSSLILMDRATGDLRFFSSGVFLGLVYPGR